MELFHQHYYFAKGLIRFQALMRLADFGQRKDAIDVGAENAVCQKRNNFRGEKARGRDFFIE